MQRARENPLLRPLLDREAKIHHEHVVRDVTHDAEIVRDEEIRDSEIALQVGHKIEDLRLHRHIERGDRLVGDEQARLQHQGACNRDALALAAGEHMRIAPGVLGPQPDFSQHVLHALAPGFRRQARVDDEWLLENGLYRLSRVERAVGILEHELHLAAEVRSMTGG